MKEAQEQPQVHAHRWSGLLAPVPVRVQVFPQPLVCKLGEGRARVQPQVRVQRLEVQERE